MRILVIHPGASFATHDVYVGCVAGLRTCPHVFVEEARLDTILGWYQGALTTGIQRTVFALDAFDRVTQHGNLSALASAHITRQALLEDTPDWALVISGHNYNWHDAAILRRAGIKTAILLTETPYFGALEVQIARGHDVVFTHERAAVVPLQQQLDAPVVYLPHAYHPTLHTPDGHAADPCDVVFIGSLFDERKALLRGVNWTGIDLVCAGLDPQQPVMDAIVPNVQAAQQYRSARIALNPHRTTTQHGSGEHIAAHTAQSLGPRAYEIAACGAFQLMDDSRLEGRDVFGDAWVTYRAGDSGDLERQIRRWLADDTGRRTVAAQQHAAIQLHSWHMRAQQMVEVLACH
jgi:spore maturation protein CgeB